MAQLSKPLLDLIGFFERLPGIGPKTATRLGFYLLNAPTEFVNTFAKSMTEMKNRIKKCRVCFGVSENETCEICNDGKRNRLQICVVERAIDVVVIENMGGYGGVYHVLGGAINPLEHIGPDELNIGELVERIRKMAKDDQEQAEIIMATNPTMEGEATALYIKRRITEINPNIRVTRIGSGLPIGADLEFADQATLNRAMEGRRGI
ncbi:MAG: recombination mediator RecR [Candidatus Shapirobacteria bacterium]|jgi:recombination protein RecR